MKYLLAIAVVGSCLVAGCGAKGPAPGEHVGPPMITTPNSTGAPTGTGTQGGSQGGLLKPGGV
jgi:hypothetical protein